MPERRKAGEAVIDLLRQEGVTHIFGIVGSSFLDIMDPLYGRDDIQFIGVRHEQGGALMADGFSRISGTPSVCLATNGPGMLNLTYGIASAYVAHSPVIVLAPSASRDHQYRNSTQEFDQVSLFRPITKAAFPINKIERLPDALRHAFRVATSGKMGPVMLDIPRDLLPGGEVELDLLTPDTYRSGQTRAPGDEVELDLLTPDTYRSGQTRTPGDRDLVEKAANVLLSAKRPVILAGGGVQWSNSADAVPSDHQYFLGHLGRLGSEEGAECTRQADVILAVGTRLSQSTTFYDHRFIPADARIVQIEIDSEEIGRNYPVAVGIEGDAKAVMGGAAGAVPTERATPQQRMDFRNHRLGGAAQGPVGGGGKAELVAPEAPAGLRRDSQGDAQGRDCGLGRRIGAQLRAGPPGLLRAPQLADIPGPGRVGVQLPGIIGSQIVRLLTGPWSTSMGTAVSSSTLSWKRRSGTDSGSLRLS